MVNGTTDFSLQYGGISKVMKTNRPVVLLLGKHARKMTTTEGTKRRHKLTWMLPCLKTQSMFSTGSLSGLGSSWEHNLDDRIVVSETKFPQGLIHRLTAERPGRRGLWGVFEGLTCPAPLPPSCCHCTQGAWPHTLIRQALLLHTVLWRGAQLTMDTAHLNHGRSFNWATVKNLRGAKPELT